MAVAYRQTPKNSPNTGARVHGVHRKEYRNFFVYGFTRAMSIGMRQKLANIYAHKTKTMQTSLALRLVTNSTRDLIIHQWASKCILQCTRAHQNNFFVFLSRPEKYFWIDDTFIKLIYQTTIFNIFIISHSYTNPTNTPSWWFFVCEYINSLIYVHFSHFFIFIFCYYQYAYTFDSLYLISFFSFF